MPIRFLPNDPLALEVVPPREQPPRPDPKDPQVGFSYVADIPEDVYPLDSAEFRFWQCREAALATLEAWAALTRPPTFWQNGQRLLRLQHDAGRGLNAHYDRTAVAFLGLETDARKTYPAASTDAVAHEVGHALLDAMRPELWESVYTETAAFHEAFADCMALLVSLFDAPSRQPLLQSGVHLRAANFLESLAEDVAEGVRLANGPNDPQALPRRALNTLQWEIPVNLPPAAPPPALTAEAHNFSRIFTGCFYDTVCNIFAGQPNQDAQGLLAAAQTAGRLLIAGAQAAPEVARFFQAVGRAMILADEAVSSGAHHAAIRDAFVGHNIAIGARSATQGCGRSRRRVRARWLQRRARRRPRPPPRCPHDGRRGASLHRDLAGARRRRLRGGQARDDKEGGGAPEPVPSDSHPPDARGQDGPQADSLLV